MISGMGASSPTAFSKHKTMKPNNRLSISGRVLSFKYAFNGLKILLKQEPNAKFHLIAAVVVVVAGFLFSISLPEWMALIFAIALVIAFETINTAIETFADFVHPENHEAIKKIKDLTAGAVLVSAIAALLVGMLIFMPKIF